jgi:deoxyribodipyrimidine photolyase-related protein
MLPTAPAAQQNEKDFQQQYHTLRLVLGDQLNLAHSWFRAAHSTPNADTTVRESSTHPDVLYVLMEVREETEYVRHHIQKVVAFFAAMRAFANELRERGHPVRYIRLDDAENLHSFSANVLALCQQHRIQHVEYQTPDEYRVEIHLQELAAQCAKRGITTRCYDTEHFLSSREEVSELFRGKKQYVLETFYRFMRRKHCVLMNPEDPNEPLTGQWNYDADNRKKLPATTPIPQPLVWKHNVEEIVTMLTRVGVETIGTIEPSAFLWAVTRSEALELLEFFARHCLEYFGTYQDAMDTRGWSLFHSRLSFAMNVKLLSPNEVIERCISEWQQRPDDISFSQIEGFVRQILGWREYMRGIYWACMPEYRQKNFFSHTGQLPAWYWTGETRMNCLHHAIKQSLDYAYAHHIQRLMVTGNFALLAGVHPDEVDAWYLGIYIDALEWVEITNTRGMSQFADGGIVGTKPYVASANYMDKMSTYCSHCHYDKSKRHNANAADNNRDRPACPFNSLYWDFYHRHRDSLARNPRIGMMYKTLDRMDAQELANTLKQAELYKNTLNTL